MRVGERLEKITIDLFLDTHIRCVVFPARMQEVPANAFYRQKYLKRIVFPWDSRLAKIGSSAFMGTSLEAFAAPASLRVLGQEAFSGCKNLRNVTLFQGVTRIPAYCFAGSGLECVAFRKNGNGTAKKTSAKGQRRQSKYSLKTTNECAFV